MTGEQPERDETTLKKLSKLFVQAPEAGDAEAAAEELRVHGVDIERLSRRIRGVISPPSAKGACEESIHPLDYLRLDHPCPICGQIAWHWPGCPNGRGEL